MFYSNDLLTKRKGGFGVYWLASTLGSKASFRKLSKKEILGCDVAHACAKLVEPDEPLALRLSSNLMLGVARVYNQQYQLHFADVQQCSQNIKKAFQDIYNATVAQRMPEIDLANNTVRNDAITLQADPAILMGLNMEWQMLEQEFARGASTAPTGSQTGDFDTDDVELPGNSLLDLDADYAPAKETKKGKKGKPLAKKGNRQSANASVLSGSKHTVADPATILLPEAQIGFDNAFGGHGFEDNAAAFQFDPDDFGEKGLIGDDFEGFDPEFQPAGSKSASVRGSEQSYNAVNFAAGDMSGDSGGNMPLPDFGAPMDDFAPDFGMHDRFDPAPFDFQPVAMDFQLEGDQPGQDVVDPENPRQSASPRRSAGVETIPEKRKKRFTKKKAAAPIIDKNIDVQLVGVKEAQDNYTAEMKRLHTLREQAEQERRDVLRAKELLFGPPEGLDAPELRELWSTFIQVDPNRGKVKPKAQSTKRKSQTPETGDEPPAKIPRIDRESSTGRSNQAAFENTYGRSGVDDLGGGLDGGYDAGYDFGGMGDVSNDYSAGNEPLPDYGSEVGRHASERASSAHAMPWAKDQLSDVDRPGTVGKSSVTGSKKASLVSEGEYAKSVRAASSLRSETPVRGRQRSISAMAQDVDMGDVGEFLLDIGDEPPSQIEAALESLQRESAEFLDYVEQKAKTLEGEFDDLLFSDIVPVAATSTRVAATAFYHVLTLASKSLLRIKSQDEAYGEIHLALVT